MRTAHGNRSAKRSCKPYSLPRVRSSVIRVWRTTIVNRRRTRRGLSMRTLLSTSVAALAMTWAAHAAEPDWSKVDAAMERTGAAQAGGIHRYGFPRSDLHVTLDGVSIKPT